MWSTVVLLLFPIGFYYYYFFFIYYYFFISVYIKCIDDTTAILLRGYTDLIVTLATASNVTMTIDAADIPTGGAMTTVSPKCDVHMMLQVFENTVFSYLG